MRVSRFFFGKPYALTSADFILYSILLIIVLLLLLIVTIECSKRPLHKGLVLLSVIVPFLGALIAYYLTPPPANGSEYLPVTILSLFTALMIASLIQLIATI